VLPRLASLLLLVLLAAPLSAATPLPFQFQDGMIWLKVAVAGRSEPLHFLLDSGAGASILDLPAARRLGIKLGRSQSVQGVSGRSAAYAVENFDACVGGVAVPTRLLAVDLSGPSRACHQRIDGLLGADFFRAHIVQIDFARQTLRLLERHEVNATGCEVLPLASRNDAWCAQVSVDGNTPEWMRLDTGCNTTLEWVAPGPKAKKLAGTTVGLNSGSVREVSADVRLGTRCLPAVKIGLHPRPMFAGESGLIGNGLLSRFVVTIDAAKKRCLLAAR
jgi:hypothetical protein